MTRGAGGDRQIVEIVVEAAAGTGPRGTVTFAERETVADWPAGVPLTDGLRIRVQPANQAARAVDVRQVAAVKGEAGVAALATAGCTEQAAVVMRGLGQ